MTSFSSAGSRSTSARESSSSRRRPRPRTPAPSRRAPDRLEPPRGRRAPGATRRRAAWEPRAPSAAARHPPPGGGRCRRQGRTSAAAPPRRSGRARRRGCRLPSPEVSAGLGESDARSVISGTDASAVETGQFCLAPSAAAMNAASSIPGTVASTESWIFVIPVPGTKVTVASTSSRSGGVPPCASPCESAIEKHAACAAAISSSGLVRPSDSSARDDHVTSSGPKAPLPTLVIVPAPSTSEPDQLTCAVRSAIRTPSREWLRT